MRPRTKARHSAMCRGAGGKVHGVQLPGRSHPGARAHGGAPYATTMGRMPSLTIVRYRLTTGVQLKGGPPLAPAPDGGRGSTALQSASIRSVSAPARAVSAIWVAPVSRVEPGRQGRPAGTRGALLRPGVATGP